MATHISHSSLPYPIKNARYTLLVPYLDADGDPTDPTTPDTEVSQDGGAFADAAEEVTTITGSNGMGYVTLTGAEMNNSAVGVAFKVASGPKNTLATLYPRNLPILESGTASAGAAGTITLASGTYTGLNLTGCFIRTTGGTGGGGTGGANNQARRITSYNTSTRVATVTPNWETTPDNTTTYDILLPEGILVPVLTALAPTILARTLDVSSAGEAGVDWANVGSPTTTLALTGTTIKTATDVETDTADIQSRLPAALVGGRMDSNTQAMANDVITAAVIANAAIDAATFAADVDAEILSYIVDDATRIDASAVNTLTSHDPGATIGTSTLTQAQVTGGAYAINSASFGFNAALDFTTTQKAATLARVTLVDNLTTYTGNTPQTGDSYAIVNSGTHGNAALKTLIDTVDNFVDTEITTIITHLTDIKGATWTTTDTLEAIRDRGDAAWITATGFSTHSASDVWAVATRVLTAGTNIQLPANGLANVTAWTVNITGTVSGNSTHSAADVITAMGTGAFLTAVPWNAAWDTEVQSEVQDAIEANHLDHLLAVDYDPASKPGVATALLNELIGSDLGVSQFTANALELAPSSGGGTVDANVISIENNVITSASITAAALNGKGDWNTTVPPTVVAIRQEIDSNSTKLDVTVGSRLASASYTAPDNTGIASAAADASTASTNTTSLLAKLGSFTGTGVNTILGFLRAIMRSDVSVPSDVGGTYDATTDALEAQSNAISNLGNLGTGTYSIALTITDGTDPVHGAHVSLSAVGQTTRSGSTDENGLITFSSDGDVTWTVTITAGGGLIYTPSTLAVTTANVTETLEMTVIPYSPPVAPNLSTGLLICLGADGLPEEGVSIYFRLVRGPETDGYAYDSAISEVVSDADGLVYKDLVRGAYYTVRRGLTGEEVRFLVPDSDTFNIAELFGAP